MPVVIFCPLSLPLFTFSGFTFCSSSCQLQVTAVPVGYPLPVLILHIVAHIVANLSFAIVARIYFTFAIYLLRYLHVRFCRLPCLCRCQVTLHCRYRCVTSFALPGASFYLFVIFYTLPLLLRYLLRYLALPLHLRVSFADFWLRVRAGCLCSSFYTVAVLYSSRLPASSFYVTVPFTSCSSFAGYICRLRCSRLGRSCYLPGSRLVYDLPDLPLHRYIRWLRSIVPLPDLLSLVALHIVALLVSCRC